MGAVGATRLRSARPVSRRPSEGPRDHRTLAPGQRSQVWIGGPDLPVPELVLDTDELLVEAPNWSLDGSPSSSTATGCSGGWTSRPRRRDRALTDRPPGLPAINNDHVLDPDGAHIYLSANDGHIYRAGLAGGPVTKVTARRGCLALPARGVPGRQPARVRAAGRFHRARPAGDHGTARTDHRGGHRRRAHRRTRVVTRRAWIYLNTEAFTDDPAMRSWPGCPMTIWPGGAAPPMPRSSGW